MTRTRRTRYFRPPSDTLQESATGRASPLTHPDACSARSMDGTNCTQTGPIFTSPERKPHSPAEQMMLLKKGGDYGWPECYSTRCAKAGSGAGIRWRRRQEAWGLRGQNRSGRRISRSLGTERDGALRQGAISRALPKWRVHRLSRLLGSGAVSARRIQRGLSAALRRSCVRPVRNICRWFRGSHQVSGRSRASSERPSRGP